MDIENAVRRSRGKLSEKEYNLGEYGRAFCKVE
jgi:hypothetical protein